VNTARAKVFYYEPTNSHLSGVLGKRIVPGLPNFESVAKGDKKEIIWVLNPSIPITVKSKTKNSDVQTEPKVKSVQLVLSKKQYEAYKQYMNKVVIVEGEFFHANTAHHRTRVLLDVRSMRQQ